MTDVIRQATAAALTANNDADAMRLFLAGWLHGSLIELGKGLTRPCELTPSYADPGTATFDLQLASGLRFRITMERTV